MGLSDCAINLGTSASGLLYTPGLFLINLTFTLLMRKLQDFLTKLPTSLPQNKFKQSQIFDRLRVILEARHRLYLPGLS